MSTGFGRIGVGFTAAVAALVVSSAAIAADWPSVKSATSVPACATPGRLMAMVKARNAGLDKRFETIATEYMRQGEAMGLRWDFAFYQMLVETNDLTFRKGVRGGAVRPDQNNVGGIGSMGGNEAGESFGSVSDGVRAHLEHLTTYAGLTVEDAISERTRKFQTWDKFREIQASLNGRAATFADVIGQWAPRSKAYLEGVQKLAGQFASEFCRKADPRPDLVAGVRVVPSEKPQKLAAVEPKAEAPPNYPKQAVDAGKVEDNNVRTNLGAGLAKAKAQSPEVKIINEPLPETAQSTPEKPVAQKTAAAAGAAATAGAQRTAPAPISKCRVWTASYGTDRALIIRAPAGDGMTNFTVLDVNKGQETREAEAYIAAYAKGGRIEGQFGSQNEALDRAFELCPEG